MSTDQFKPLEMLADREHILLMSSELAPDRSGMHVVYRDTWRSRHLVEAGGAWIFQAGGHSFVANATGVFSIDPEAPMAEVAPKAGTIAATASGEQIYVVARESVEGEIRAALWRYELDGVRVTTEEKLGSRPSTQWNRALLVPIDGGVVWVNEENLSGTGIHRWTEAEGLATLTFLPYSFYFRPGDGEVSHRTLYLTVESPGHSERDARPEEGTELWAIDLDSGSAKRLAHDLQGFVWLAHAADRVWVLVEGPFNTNRTGYLAVVEEDGLRVVLDEVHRPKALASHDHDLFWTDAAVEVRRIDLWHWPLGDEPPVLGGADE